jgi:TetR/AcrR family transcriptional regulator
MPRTRIQTQTREAAILDAARQRFAHYGIGKVTMDEVAADVGLKKASLYYYFRTKEDLFRSVIEREEQSYLSALGEFNARDLRPEEKLRLFGARRLELFGSLLNLAQFKAESWSALVPALKPLFMKVEAEELRFVTGLLREGIARKEFRVRDPKQTAALILHVLQGLRMRVVKNAQTSAAAAENYRGLSIEINHLFDLLMRGIIAPADHHPSSSHGTHDRHPERPKR